MTDAAYDAERVANIESRAAILASAVGIARLKLRGGDADGALAALDAATEKTLTLIRDAQAATAREFAS